MEIAQMYDYCDTNEFDVRWNGELLTGQTIGQYQIKSNDVLVVTERIGIKYSNYVLKWNCIYMYYFCSTTSMMYIHVCHSSYSLIDFEHCFSIC